MDVKKTVLIDASNVAHATERGVARLENIVHQAPSGTDADYFILSFAREMDARVLTNDRYRDRAEEFQNERDRIIRFMIVDGAVVFEQRGKRRH
ncbi:MAG: hypothetical protein WD825_01695 [Gemmatimonadaceae bacterium]